MTQAIWTTSDLVSSENSVKLILFKLGLNFGRFPGSCALYRFVSEYDVISGYLSMTDCLEWLKLIIKSHLRDFLTSKSHLKWKKRFLPLITAKHKTWKPRNIFIVLYFCCPFPFDEDKKTRMVKHGRYWSKYDSLSLLFWHQNRMKSIFASLFQI